MDQPCVLETPTLEVDNEPEESIYEIRMNMACRNGIIDRANDDRSKG